MTTGAGSAPSGSVPAGERLLWRGSPDLDRVTRRWWASLLRGIAAQLVGLALFFFSTGTLSPLRGADLVVIGVLVAALVVPQLLRARQPRRFATSTSYLLTDQRLLIDAPHGRRDLRLLNLPDLRLELQGDGFGSILFSPPTGATSERYRRQLSRWIPQMEDQSELLACIPDAARVMSLLNAAQGHALQAGADAAATPGDAAALASGAGPATVPVEAPIARQSFMQAAGVMPIWFGGAFLAMGLFVMWFGLSASRDGSGLLVAGFGLFFALPGALFVRARYLVLREKGRLQSVGVHASGRVLDLAGTGTQVNDAELWIVRYAFEVNGAERRGQSAAVPWESVARFAGGDAVDVVYDPADPSRNSLPAISDLF